jgi:hypothetical protein
MLPTVWDKLDIAVASAGPLQAAGTAGDTTRRFWRRWAWVVINAWATALWLYAVCKVFVFDIDSYLVQRLFPQGGWVVTYRFLILIALVAWWGLILGRGRFVVWALYFLFFPLIVVGWYFPRFIYRRQSWIALLAVVNVITSLIRDFRYSLVTKVGAILAIAIILRSSSDPLTLFAGAVLLVILVVTYLRTLSLTFRASRFIADQETFITRLIDSPSIVDLWTLKAELKSPQVTKFDSTQQTTFMTAVGWGVICNRALYFWAYQLESYRKGSAPYLFALLSYFWLFSQTLVVFAFANYALFRADPTAFTYAAQPQPFDFVHYAFNQMLLGSIDYLAPKSAVALILSDLARFFGPVLFITVLGTFVLTLRQTRQDDQMKDAIERIKSRGHALEKDFESQYDASVAEAIDRLKQAPGYLVRIGAWLSRQIPADFS